MFRKRQTGKIQNSMAYGYVKYLIIFFSFLKENGEKSTLACLLSQLKINFNCPFVTFAHIPPN